MSSRCWVKSGKDIKLSSISFFFSVGYLSLAKTAVLFSCFNSSLMFIFSCNTILCLSFFYLYSKIDCWYFLVGSLLLLICLTWFGFSKTAVTLFMLSSWSLMVSLKSINLWLMPYFFTFSIHICLIKYSFFNLELLYVLKSLSISFNILICASCSSTFSYSLCFS